MSRRTSTSTNWIPLWNANNGESDFAIEDDAKSHTSKEQTVVSNEPNADNEDAGVFREPKSLGESKKARKNSNKVLKKKNSSTSLASLSAGSWLNWSRGNRELPQHQSANNKEEKEDGSSTREEADYVPDNDGEEMDTGEDIDNDDEIDDHIPHDRKKSSSSWSFWNGNNQNLNATENEGAQKKQNSMSNTILSSTPSIPGKQGLMNNFASKSTPVDKARDSGSKNVQNSAINSEEDDAVLYKPHNNPNQFSKINTHKNENLKENVIVPSWDSCLPFQPYLSSSTSAITGTLFGNSSTSSQHNNLNSKMDMKSWRQFLNQLSSKLGFSSNSLTQVVEGENDGAENNDSNNLEREFNLLYEKTYRLYGRCLARLPNHKRACLPNYSKCYKYNRDQDSDEEASQLEEPDSISVSNDPMGNLLINHKPSRHSKPTVQRDGKVEILSNYPGQLKKIKKILIIGVHGFFPTKMIRPLIGSPKGTSLKFANEAEKAIIRYCVENNLINDSEESSVSIQKIALEKEGKIFDRVDFFTEILIKWKQELNDADFIFIASHSQGCVVSIILLAKLIELGVLADPIKKRIGLLGMAGINNGPFYGANKTLFMKAYSAIEHESLLELFELTKFTSEQSLEYKKSMQIIVNANVKICFIGSINDQLVPLYSALASHIFHPNIYRACYMDHSSQTPDFIQKLVSICCKLQNIGYFDNNVLKEISSSLAGPLTGGGHSKIYNDGKVYDLGVKFALDTEDIVIPSAKGFQENLSRQEVNESSAIIPGGYGNYGSTNLSGDPHSTILLPITNQLYIKEYNVGKIGTNPFILPWCFRGLLFNIEKNWPNNNKLLSVESGSDLGKNGYDEINELYELFENWKPDSKVLKELKFRLNGLRASKL